MNILLIMPEFHNYENIIIDKLNQKDNNVVFSKLMFNETFFDRLKRKFSIEFIQKKYYCFLKNEILRNKNTKFDRVIVVFGGECFTKDCFYLLKEAFKGAEFIYYNWDSVKNNSQSLSYYKLFDKYYSFDLEDCKKYGYAFLTVWYSFVNQIQNVIKYDYGSLMTFSDAKVKGYLAIKSLLPHNLIGKEYLVMPLKGSYFHSKIKYHNLFKFIDKKNIYSKWLPLDEAISFYNDCKAVIDIPLDGQNGLTTRTFEVLKLEKKLITTNKAIKQYEFYTPNNIFVVEENTKEIPMEFFKTPFDKNYCISEKYSLESFVKTLFDLDKE